MSFSLALQWITPFLEHCPSAPPPAFSPQWQDEPDEQVRFVSVLVSALQWAMQAEARQDALQNASHEISDALDWATEAQHLGYRNSASHIKRQMKGAA
ncbi:DUF2742 domain-containing protein [Tsukamurella sp. USMM236]|uniref:DUF2742 domain-containing protein n=1 Tax=Tsukamurella sp. USMM236 TaxID=3081301 RepID=UPI00301B1720